MEELTALEEAQDKHEKEKETGAVNEINSSEEDETVATMGHSADLPPCLAAASTATAGPAADFKKISCIGEGAFGAVWLAGQMLNRVQTVRCWV